MKIITTATPGVITHVRVLLVVILLIAMVVVGLIFWQGHEHDKTNTIVINYHDASSQYLGSIHTETLLIKNNLDEITSQNADILNNVNQLRLIHELIQSVHIINQSANDIFSIQKEYQDPKFLILTNRLQTQLLPLLSLIDSDLAIEKIESEINANNINALLLTLNQFERLHKFAGRELLEKANLQEKKRIKLMLGLLLVIMLVGGFTIKNTFRSIKTILRDQKNTEDRLFRERELVHTTLVSIGDAVITTDRAGLITTMNPVAENLTGWSNAEAQGQSVKSIFPIIDASTREPIETPVEKVINTGEVVYLSNHTTLIARDGTEYQIADSAAPIRDKDNNILGMVLVFNDVTEQYHLRMVAAKSKRDMQAIMDHSPAVIFVKDSDGRYTFINQQFKTLFLLQDKDIIGKTSNDIFSKDIADEMQRNDKIVLETGRILESEVVTPLDDGLHTYFSIKFPLFNEEGKIYAVCGISTDITERKQVEKENIRFSRIFENSLNEIYLFDANTLKFVQANNAAQLNLGYTVKELRELTAVDIKPDFTMESFTELLIPLHKGEKEKLIFETTHKRKDNSLYDAEVHLQLFKQDQEILFVAIVMDISERKQTEEQLKKLVRAVEYSSTAVYITDLNGDIEYINPKFTKITGYTNEEIIGENPRILSSGETPEEVYAALWETISSGKEWQGIFHNRKKDGSLYWARNSISGVKNAKGEISHYIAIQEDVTYEYELSEQISYQANHDALTGLVNRHEFERRAERLLTTVHQGETKHALCFMDLDQFKVVNDTCGHIAGDELLRQLSSVLQHTVRQRDTLARLGGDEFGILMEHCTLDQAHRVACTLQKAIQDYQFSWEEHTFKVGVSIGLVAITNTIPNLTELLKQADAACYMAKDLGRNRIHVYHAEDSELTRRHGEMQWVARLNQALEEDRFKLYAQTIVPLDSSTNKHYELLLRMIDEKGKIVPPNAFLPAAERYNLIKQLDTWVVENTLSLLAASPAFVNHIHFISINLSGQSLTDTPFLDFVIKQLQDTKIEGNKICFEITETAAISNLNSAINFITTIKELGCQFALDDFGSGLSSFAYLKNLPVDYLKIDGMFVKDIAVDPIDHAMVKSINEIGQVMGMKTIAEFVENDEIKGMLREIGVNFAQGYGIDKPKPFDELLNRSNNVTNIKTKR